MESVLESCDEAARRIQRKIVYSVEKGDIVLDTNLQKGNYGEIKMDTYYEGQGYERISVDRVTDLNQSSHQGIDGVYYDAGPPPKYVIAEAKYNTSKLSTTQDGKQMSDTWIYGGDRLDNAVGEEMAHKIRKELLFNADNVQSELFHTSPDGEVVISIIDPNGNIAH